MTLFSKRIKYTPYLYSYSYFHLHASNIQNSLVSRCNLTTNTAGAVMDQGFNNPTAFLKVKAKDIDSLCVHINKNVVNSTISFLSIADLKTYGY